MILTVVHLAGVAFMLAQLASNLAHVEHFEDGVLS